ncbi:MAG TPA: hypothetical protein VNM40_02970 [Candidatus Paceibacterota bacterium]|nr:hypothetical protein [Candidatus Paceibacterota bacterium]
MHSFFNLSPGAKILLAVCSVVVLAEGLYINYVMGGSTLSVFDARSSCERVLAKWEEAHPEEAKNRELYTGPIADVDYENTPLTQAANFRTAINEAVAAGPNFAGKYAVAQWGCPPRLGRQGEAGGTGCQSHAVVNVESGKIIALGPGTEAGLGISPESPVMITNPKENFPSPADMQKADLQTLISLANIPREYYVLEGTTDDNVRLQKLCTESPFEENAF